MKFPLAYHCGRVLLDREFGVLWAMAMFIPGWSTIEMLVFNPNAVATATLAVPGRASASYWKRPMGFGSFAILGLAFALAIHVHPTSLPMALPIITCVASSSARRPARERQQASLRDSWCR